MTFSFAWGTEDNFFLFDFLIDCENRVRIAACEKEKTSPQNKGHKRVIEMFMIIHKA